MTTPERLQYRSLMAANAQPAAAGRYNPCSLCGKEMQPYRRENGCSYWHAYHDECWKVVKERRRRAAADAVNRGGA